ncbi:gamma-glutamyl-phosphate reductase, partial [Clavibacter michiganensis subsp. insidiosus]
MPCMPSNASGAPDTVPADPTTSPADALERILEAARAASTDLAATTS